MLDTNAQDKQSNFWNALSTFPNEFGYVGYLSELRKDVTAAGIDRLREYSNNTLQRTISDMYNKNILTDLLTDMLHGSGWDGEWMVSRAKNGDYELRIGYHAMNEHGYYDGWFDVVTKVDMYFDVITTTFKASSTARRKYITDQSDYYYEAVSHALRTLRSAVIDGHVVKYYSTNEAPTNAV